MTTEKRAGPKGKPGRKKQGREINEKKRWKNFKLRSDKDPNRPMKKHTPRRDHKHAKTIIPYIISITIRIMVNLQYDGVINT